MSGFWHGANWTFIFWGLFHSVLFLPSFIFKTNRKYTTSIIAENTFLPSPKELLQVGNTFILVTIGWVFFRSDSIFDSFGYLYKMFFDFLSFQSEKLETIFLSGLGFIFLEFLLKNDERCILFSKKRIVNNIFFLFLGVIIVLLFFKKNNENFIYFQF